MAEVKEAVSNKAVAVACISVGRFLALEHPKFEGYLRQSLEHAERAGLPESDLALLRLMVGPSHPSGTR